MAAGNDRKHLALTFSVKTIALSLRASIHMWGGRPYALFVCIFTSFYFVFLTLFMNGPNRILLVIHL